MAAPFRVAATRLDSLVSESLDEAFGEGPWRSGGSHWEGMLGDFLNALRDSEENVEALAGWLLQIAENTEQNEADLAAQIDAILMAFDTSWENVDHDLGSLGHSPDDVPVWDLRRPVTE